MQNSVAMGADAAVSGGALTSWCADVRTEWAAFSLHPPIAFDLTTGADAYRCLLPYGSGAWDLAIGGGPPVRRRVRAGSVTFVEPGISLALCSADFVEFLLLAIAPERMRHLGEAAAPGRVWRARALLDHLDPSLAALGAEVRRSLLADAVAAPPYLQTLADAIATRLLCHFLGQVETNARGEALSPATLNRIITHIDAGLSGGFTVEELAEMAKLTRSHFSRAFQRMTGQPPQRFILKRRVCRARDLLSSGEGSLAEVAARAGFSSQAHLSTVFRKEVGTTPARYRATFRGKDGGGETP
jgi:AraC family transcriptional regulator